MFGVVMLAQLTGMLISAVLAVVRAEAVPTGIRLVQAVLVATVVIVARAAWRPQRSALPAILLAAVLASLYPVTTVILATLVLAERLTRDHAIGIGLAVIAIAFIGVGSA